MNSNPKNLKSTRAKRKTQKNENQSNTAPSDVESCGVYKKRRYLCPGKRRYKAGKRCCSKRYKKTKINLCNRNWSRISIYPFINFLKVFRRRFRKDTPIGVVAGKARCKWRKMCKSAKEKYYEQAKRARKRGFRT